MIEYEGCASFGAPACGTMSRLVNTLDRWVRAFGLVCALARLMTSMLSIAVAIS